MSLSSINFQTAQNNSSSHMSRNSFVSYLIEHDNNRFEYKHYQDPKKYLEFAQVQTKLLTKRSMQSSAIKNFIQEAVLNIKKDTTIEDVENLFKTYNKEFKGGFKVFEIALHKDEGVFIDTKHNVDDLVFDSKTLKIYKDGIDVSDEVISLAPNKDIFYDKDSKKWYKEKDFKTEIDTSKLQKKMNYHAHISFTKWEELTGKNVRLQKSDLQNIQTITAREMKMERGEENSQFKRLNHYQIKKLQSENNSQKQEQRELKLVTVPQLQADNINLKNELLKLKEEQKKEREELQKSGGVRSDYAALEQKHRDEIQELTATVAVADNQAINASKTNETLKASNDTLKSDLKRLKQDMSVLNASLIEKQKKVQELVHTVEKLEKQNTTLSATVAMFKNTFNEFYKLLPRAVRNKVRKFSEIVAAVKQQLSSEQYTQSPDNEPVQQKSTSKNEFFETFHKRIENTQQPSKNELYEFHKRIENAYQQQDYQ